MHYTVLPYRIGGRTLASRFLVTKLKDRIILGMQWLKQHNPIVNWNGGYFQWEERGAKVFCNWAHHCR